MLKKAKKEGVEKLLDVMKDKRVAAARRRGDFEQGDGRSGRCHVEQVAHEDGEDKTTQEPVEETEEDEEELALADVNTGINPIIFAQHLMLLALMLLVFKACIFFL
ncbi:hypothetical protein CERZMDRAFT_103363 [Cercospora zeae-maydis SCOH1-5]|uniref:Uncharacterized protein n=1 Tax=Cercospora zeae-maydis SCOH1-5 TaxID=717836 RepID=A0A6A6EZN3_9PEZI|nr:hypothetical protein CERZMDRAFT_103363 [Cercospora zeae-maydis SCOH1-5]